MNKKWVVKNRDHNISETTIATLLRDRGIKDVEHFLNPQESDLISWKKLSNISKALSMLEKHIEHNSPIAVVVDSDFDGVASAVIFIRYIKNFTNNIEILHHNSKAHGLEDMDLDNFSEFKLVVLPDGLSSNYEEYETLYNRGVDILLLDHHPQYEPTEFAVTVNCTLNGYPNKNLSGGAVTWKFCKAYDELHGTNYAEDLVDLAACSIIGDVMNISETSMENRYICSKGFDSPKNTAIKAIIGSYAFNSTSVIYSIANLSNACIRLGRCDLMMDLFLTDDKKEAKRIIAQAKELKTEQDLLVSKIIADVIEKQFAEIDLSKESILIASISQREVAGLVANKLTSIYNRSVIIISENEINIDNESWLTGSCRSFGNEDIRGRVNETQIGIAEGHKYASGFKIKSNQLLEFKEKLNSSLPDKIPTEQIEIDIELYADEITEAFVNELEKVNRITGSGFDKISVMIADIKPKNKYILNKKHSCVNSDRIQFFKWNDISLVEACDTCDTVDLIAELETSKYSAPFKGIVREFRENISLPFML